MNIQLVYTLKPNFREERLVSLKPFKGCISMKAVRLEDEDDKHFIDRIKVEINKMYFYHVKENINGVIISFLTNNAITRGNGYVEPAGKRLIYLKAGSTREIRFAISDILQLRHDDINIQHGTDTAIMSDGILVPLELYNKHINYYNEYIKINTVDIEFTVETANEIASAILNAMINNYEMLHMDGNRRVPTLAGLQYHLSDMRDMELTKVIFMLD